MGSVLSNFAVVMTIPSWCNEKKENVSVNRTLYYSMGTCLACYLFLGLIAAAVFQHHLSASSDFLTVMIANTDNAFLKATIH